MRTSGIIVAFPFYRFRSYDSCCTHSTQKKCKAFFTLSFFLPCVISAPLQPSFVLFCILSKKMEVCTAFPHEFK